MPMQSMYCLMVVTGLGGLMYAHQQSWGAQASVPLLVCFPGVALQWSFLTLPVMKSAACVPAHLVTLERLC